MSVKSITKAYTILSTLLKKERSININKGGTTIFKKDSRYFSRLHIPGWPSKAFNRLIDNEAKININGEYIGLQFIIIAISSCCPLNCEHCYEWNRLNGKELLNISQLKLLIKKFQDIGVCQIHLSGGEPLTRFDDLVELLKCKDEGTDFWLLTSGYNLNKEMIETLKKVGLTGISISLDHWDSHHHNKFRGNKQSYNWVINAAKNIVANQMPLCLSLCATKEFVSQVNLEKYYILASKLKANFIQILEPRNIGHYHGQNVDLDEIQLKILDEFYLKMNSKIIGKSQPVIVYAGYHQRRNGCFGGGLKHLYVDSLGNMHSCPFCQGSVGNCLEEPIADLIKKLRKTGCHKFPVISKELYKYQ